VILAFAKRIISEVNVSIDYRQINTTNKLGLKLPLKTVKYISLRKNSMHVGLIAVHWQEAGIAVNHRQIKLPAGITINGSVGEP